MEKIQFTDPDTNEVVEFAVEEQTQLNGIRYLLVSDGNENGDSEAYILKEIKTQDEEVFYEMVDDDTEFAALAKIFAELADEEHSFYIRAEYYIWRIYEKTGKTE
jgi:hypothetical protein